MFFKSYPAFGNTKGDICSPKYRSYFITKRSVIVKLDIKQVTKFHYGYNVTMVTMLSKFLY